MEDNNTKYTTILGDTWDLISHKVYGDSNIHSLIKSANPKYSNVFIFQSGVVLNIPKFEKTETSEGRAPWRR